MLCTWSQCSGCESPVRPGDGTAARQWVGRFIGNEVVMSRLRQLAQSSGADESPLMSDNQALADRIAASIMSGSIRVCGPAKAVTLYGLTTLKAPAAAPAPPAAAPTAPRSAPVAPPPPVETTFGSELDVAAMVAVLRAAAKEGVPFCEECAKAAVKRQLAAEASP